MFGNFHLSHLSSSLHLAEFISVVISVYSKVPKETSPSLTEGPVLMSITLTIGNTQPDQTQPSMGKTSLETAEESSCRDKLQQNISGGFTQADDARPNELGAQDSSCPVWICWQTPQLRDEYVGLSMASIMLG